ncbi:MAG: HaeIII restriction endonuclease [bacterium ADurb.Bin425]|nr:MAG: HaeIII restriction endonuclease [bacterium ADurb.Bin425]
MSNSKQNQYGRAFEFSILRALLAEHSQRGLDVKLSQTSALRHSTASYHELELDAQTEMDRASTVGISMFCQLEPSQFDTKLSPSATVYLSEDSAGQKGDPRDIVIERGDWRVGISAKHNSLWVKSPRLSNLASFGPNWLGVKCTEEYCRTVESAFETVRKRGVVNWKDLEEVDKQRLYKDVLVAFSAEIEELQRLHGEPVVTSFFRFLLGTHDYYKIAKIGNATHVQPFNPNGSLTASINKAKPLTLLKKSALPKRILKAEVTAWNRMRLYFDAGWQIELRIHNKDKEIGRSVGFETEVIGQPADIFTILLPW